VPREGFGSRLTNINAWLDENCGADDWAMTPAGLRGVVNDAVAIYFLDAASAAVPMPKAIQIATTSEGSPSQHRVARDGKGGETFPHRNTPCVQLLSRRAPQFTIV
jgi:hypothetical protein